MPDLHSEFNRRQLMQIERITKRIRDIFNRSIIQIAIRAQNINVPVGRTFTISSFPILEQEIERQVNAIHDGVFQEIKDGITASWNLANEKNTVMLDRRFQKFGRFPAANVRKILYDPNVEAMRAFITRKENGLNLSKRVWNLIEPFKKEMELSIGIGISEGKPAASMASQAKQFLNEPDRLYRRVREIKGDPDSKLKLSKSAAEYHPGQGVYRSSYKNAFRLTRTETNMAYQSADFEKWNQLPFVVGYEVRLSNAHPRFDICDRLTGKYPKNFKFIGWHPQCLCIAIPLQLTDSEYEKYEDQILGRGTFDGKSVNMVVSPPASFSKYLSDNTERIQRMKRKPYWVRDNKAYIGDALKAKAGQKPGS